MCHVIVHSHRQEYLRNTYTYIYHGTRALHRSDSSLSRSGDHRCDIAIAMSPPHAQEKELSHQRSRVSLRASDGKLVIHTTEMILWSMSLNPQVLSKVKYCRAMRDSFEIIGPERGLLERSGDNNRLRLPPLHLPSQNLDFYASSDRMMC